MRGRRHQNLRHCFKIAGEEEREKGEGGCEQALGEKNKNNQTLCKKKGKNDAEPCISKSHIHTDESCAQRTPYIITSDFFFFLVSPGCSKAPEFGSCRAQRPG